VLRINNINECFKKTSRNFLFKSINIIQVKNIIGADLFIKNDITAKFDEIFFMYYDLEYELKKLVKYFS
jgi:hypothetical protein